MPTKAPAKKTVKKAVKREPRILTRLANLTPKKHVLIDFETYYDDECSVRTLGPVAYTHHPQFDAYLVSVYDGPNGDFCFCGHPRDFDWKQLKGRLCVAHNSQFDIAVYDWLVRKKIAPPRDHIWHDSAAIAAFAGAPRTLLGATQHLLKREINKDLRGWMKGKTPQDCVNAGKWDAMLEYCLSDSKNAWEIYDLFFPLMPPEEVQMMVFTVESGLTGAAIDMDYLKASMKSLAKEHKKVCDRIPWFETAKPTSPKAIAQACRDIGITPPASTAEDNPFFEEWLKEYSEKAPFVQAVSDYRKINRVVELLNTLHRRIIDSIFSWSKKYYGAHTGRWSGDGGFNMENLPQDPMHGVDIRHLFKARPGKKLLVADFAQIEARILLWFADDQKTLDLIRKGVSVYEAHARQTMGWTGGVLKKENPTLYKLAKARVLGLGFGCGHKKFVDAARNLADVTISLEESKKVVNAYRFSNKGVTDLWDKLGKAIIKAAHPQMNPSGEYELELPSGRVLRYFNVVRKMGQIFSQKVRGANHTPLYGGLLTENLVQATARDVLRDAVIRCLAIKDVAVLFTVHDEVVLEVPEKMNVSPIIDALKVSPEWLEGCPMDVEWKETQNYCK
jgi:DNA polymerase I-like protein with 3'-5' exonuclease and polymerase domains